MKNYDLSNKIRNAALILGSAAIMTSACQSATATYEPSITPTQTPTVYLTDTPNPTEEPSLTPTLTYTLEPSATPDPRYDGNSILESLVFYANVNDITKHSLLNAEFYQADYEDLYLRVRQAVRTTQFEGEEQNSYLPGDVISNPVKADENGVYRFNVDVPLLNSEYGFMEVGHMVDGEFVELPYVGLSEAIGSVDMPQNEEKLGMRYVVDTITYEDKEYPIMRQVFNINEVEQPDDKGTVLPGYRDFIFLKVPYNKLEDIANNFDVQTPNPELLQWVGIIAEGQEPYRLVAGHPMDLTQTISDYEKLLNTTTDERDYSGILGNWQFLDLGFSRDVEAEGEFLCRPVADGVYRRGGFETFVDNPVRPLQNNYWQFFMDRDDFQSDEIALVCGVRPTATPKKDKPTETPKIPTPTPHDTPTQPPTKTPPPPTETPKPTPTPPILQSPTPNDP